MDIEKLIEQLHNFEECAYGYHINGEVLGVDCSDFEQVMVDAAEEISKIPTLQAENERLKNKLSELAHLPFDEPGIGERTRLMAENAELRAELEQVKRDFDGLCEYIDSEGFLRKQFCENGNPDLEPCICPSLQEHPGYIDSDDCEVCDHFCNSWRGPEGEHCANYYH